MAEPSTGKKPKWRWPLPQLGGKALQEQNRLKRAKMARPFFMSVPQIPTQGGAGSVRRTKRVSPFREYKEGA